jgi:cell division protein ZapA (FtsZ GTPase activity inhibitor)
MSDSGKRSVDVNILGQTIRIRHDDEEYVRLLEGFVNEKLESLQTQQKIPSLQLAARVLLILADEYFGAQRERDDLQRSIDQKAQKMIDLIDGKVATH